MQQISDFNKFEEYINKIFTQVGKQEKKQIIKNLPLYTFDDWKTLYDMYYKKGLTKFVTVNNVRKPFITPFEISSTPISQIIKSTMENIKNKDRLQDKDNHILHPDMSFGIHLITSPKSVIDNFNWKLETSYDSNSELREDMDIKINDVDYSVNMGTSLFRSLNENILFIFRRKYCYRSDQNNLPFTPDLDTIDKDAQVAVYATSSSDPDKTMLVMRYDHSRPHENIETKCELKNSIFKTMSEHSHFHFTTGIFAPLNTDATHCDAISTSSIIEYMDMLLTTNPTDPNYEELHKNNFGMPFLDYYLKDNLYQNNIHRTIEHLREILDDPLRPKHEINKNVIDSINVILNTYDGLEDMTNINPISPMPNSPINGPDFNNNPPRPSSTPQLIKGGSKGSISDWIGNILNGKDNKNMSFLTVQRPNGSNSNILIQTLSGNIMLHKNFIQLKKSMCLLKDLEALSSYCTNADASIICELQASLIQSMCGVYHSQLERHTTASIKQIDINKQQAILNGLKNGNLDLYHVDIRDLEYV